MTGNRPDNNSGRPRAEVGIDYEMVFRAGLTPCAVITPDLVVADVNDAYLAVAGRPREVLVGSDLLNLLSRPASEERTEGSVSLPASVVEVLRSGKPDVMDVLRYPVFDKQTGSFQVRYFIPINIPVFDEGGAVAWILHRVEEVTDYLNLAASRLPTHTAPRHFHFARARDLVRRNRELALQASHDRAVSRILQDAMLTELPEPDHLQLGARYVANTAADQVGGDWYDATVLPAGATMVAVGDVVGHDITAAASMGQLRGLLRAVAWDRDEPPSAILVRVERAMAGLKLDTLATAVLGRIEQADARGIRQLRWSNAGHPPPLLVSGDGAVEVLETRNDVPLGAGLSLPRFDHVHPLTPGSVLILYTDGLVERRDRTRDEGIDQLARALSRHHDLPPERLVDQIIVEVAGSAPEDDIALLAVSVDPEIVSTRPARGR